MQVHSIKRMWHGQRKPKRSRVWETCIFEVSYGNVTVVGSTPTVTAVAVFSQHHSSYEAADSYATSTTWLMYVLFYMLTRRCTFMTQRRSQVLASKTESM